MMDGYSITEAASVLGVPTERVWELLARGVLAGAPEGETGMRVFLQPRPAPAPVTASFADDPGAPASNGPERELSPFRELLTEFRNLTERYGQALLALGESRGEVASLRTRVDLLEARIDLRLPMGTAAPPWPPQPQPASAPAGEQDEEEAHRRRRRGARRATESFAEALARAEDPSPADLPSGTDAAFVSDPAAEDTDRSLPRDVLPAEPVLVAEEGQEAEPTGEDADLAAGSEEVEEVGQAVTDELGSVSPEPMAAADGEPAAADIEAVVADAEPTVADLEPPIADLEPVDQDEAAVPDQVEPVAFEPPVEDLQLADAGAWAMTSDIADEGSATESFVDDATPERIPVPAVPEWSVEAEPGDELEPHLESEAHDEPGQEREVESVEVEALPDLPEVESASEPPFGLEPDEEPPIAVADEETEERPMVAIDQSAVEDVADAVDFDAERYTSVIDQPDWFEAEVDDEWSSGETIGEAEGPTAPVEPPPREPDAPEAEAREEGADEMEVAGGGQVAPLHPDASSEAELPGSSELNEALEAYGGLGARPIAPSPDDEEWPPATSGGPRMSSSVLGPSGYASRPLRSSYGSPIPGSPATRAYRRLRRIFPT